MLPPDDLHDFTRREISFENKTKPVFVRGAKERSPLIFVHRGKKERAPSEAEKNIVLPAAINVSPSMAKKDKQAAAALNAWVKAVTNYWLPEPSGLGMVRVHSKVVVVDPFGNHPVIITGSHNLGPKASNQNDDNMVIIENDSAAATQYAVNIMTVYNQYRWRFQQYQAVKNHQRLNQWNGLKAPWKAQATYLSPKSEMAKEFRFWL